ncbi:MAG: hypothetical protein BHW00_07540 [Clostridium sp. 26_22]|nr:MAG: hypothetical protein BHW00_07540 [Clostridium sp. 26_22]
MEQENRKYIAIIAFLRKFLNVFFSLFFNIYILKIVNNDMNFILKYTIYSVFLSVILEYILLKIINSKNAGIIYRSSFVLSAISIFLLIIFKENIVKYIYLFKTLDTMKSLFYAVPYELIIIGSNTNKSMSSYLANLNILENITAILTPMFSGFIIEKFSYNVLFITLGLETLLIIAISMKIKDFTVQDSKMKIKEFWKIAKEKTHLKDIYKCMFFRRISSQGAMTELLPIVLFLRLGTEMSFGSYNTLFAVISIISLQILKIINSKKVNKKFYPYMAIIIFVSSLLVVFNSSFVTLLIYYILMNSFGTIIESESCSAIYSSIKVDNLEQYRKEHMMVFNIYMFVGQVISYSLVYVLYNYFYNVNILSISISILMFFLIIATIYLRKTEQYLYDNN